MSLNEGLHLSIHTYVDADGQSVHTLLKILLKSWDTDEVPLVVPPLTCTLLHFVRVGKIQFRCHKIAYLGATYCQVQ